MGSGNKTTIVVETTVTAAVDKVWDCWTNTEHIIHWNFASPEWCCPKAENDVVPNGKFSWRMEAKDGSMGFDFTGTYMKIIKNQCITYLMSDGRGVRVDFLKNGDQVTVRETFEAEGSHSDEQQRAGWQAILDNFKNYLESQKQ